MEELTPMMRQYSNIKAENPDCILFFRLGDFYEMFAEDAKVAAAELNLTLTTRDRSKDKEDKVPMCGVPYHSCEGYIARLVAKGYKVAICEQIEDPAQAKGLVKRDITRIVTPGALTESAMLDERRNNYFACVFEEDGVYGVCFCDISTGAFYATSASGSSAAERVINELACFSPSELLLGGGADREVLLPQALRERFHCCVDAGAAERFELEAARAEVTAQFGAGAAELEPVPATLRAAGALLQTLKRLQKSALGNVRSVEYYVSGRFMDLDPTARRNLELTETLRSKEKRGSLLGVLDKTRTAMGSRLLRSWLERPLLNPALIGKRLDAVAELAGDTVAREELIELLRQVSDLERLMARIVNGTANGRDLAALSAGCESLPALKEAANRLQSGLLATIAGSLDPLDDLKSRIDRCLVDEPPFSVREGGLIREGYHEEVDRLRSVMDGGTGALAAIQAREREKTGIRTLRVGYNKVFGYYIEVSKGQAGQVPDSYVRKQTLANGERYITSELKELENTILTARERIASLEYELFTELRNWLAGQTERVRQTAGAVAALDALSCFAHVAVKNRYCRPEVDLSDGIVIREGRHPVVEQMLKDALFVPNDTVLGAEGTGAAIITGPNMAGKSTYMRQVALIALMAQCGSFVPAAEARIGIVDRIFTRIGASDDLASGKSTFMVEMSEVAEMLRSATPRSLLILDEIGRGTSTFDGMAIARAVLEYAADKKRLGARTLFATHYHELTALEGETAGVRNFNIAVKRRQGEIVFLRKIVPGPADGSFGVDVARLAGLPERVVARARQLLKELEAGEGKTVPHSVPQDDQISMTDLRGDEVRRRLEGIHVETLTPIEALNTLYELKKLL